MADFRKRLSAFAILMALVLAFGMTASAQNQVTCAAQAGSPPNIRKEGLTELVGDIQLNCNISQALLTAIQSGGTGGAAQPLIVNFQVYMNTNVTSRILTTSATPYLGTLQTFSEAILLYDPTNQNGPAPAAATPYNYAAGGYQATANAFRGATGPGTNSLIWSNVAIIPTGTNFSFRISNVRVVASSVPAGVSGIPGQVQAYVASAPLVAPTISGSLAGNVTVNNQQVTVGFVTTGLLFQSRSCGSSSAGQSTPSFSQCSSNGGNVTATPVSTTGNNVSSGSVQFQEQFQYAFKTGAPSNYMSVPAAPNYQYESGYFNYSTPACTTTSGGVTTCGAGLGPETGIPTPGFSSISSPAGPMGTRTMVKFDNVPNGVSMWVATTPGVNSTGGVLTSASGIAYATGASSSSGTQFKAQLLQSTDSNGNLGAPANAQYTIVTCADWQTYVGVTQLTPTSTDPVTGFQTFVAVYEVTANDPTLTEWMQIPYVAKWSTNTSTTPQTPGAGTATATGQFAPLSSVKTMSAVDPIPRFDSSVSTKVNLFTINPCVTNLLFPFVTTAGGTWDTGIAVQNTSQDPITNNNRNSGICTFSFYTSVGAANPTAIVASSASVGAGQGVIFPMSAPEGSTIALTKTDGSGLKAADLANFTGYLFVQCKFQYAHGYAFISDLGVKNFAQGYIALVLPGGTRGGSATLDPAVKEQLNN